MKYAFLFPAFLCIFIFQACKTKPAAVDNSKPVDPTQYEAWWKQVDSLEQKGLATSALEVVRKIKKASLAGQQSGHLIKAVVYENKFLIQLEEDSAIKALIRGEEEINSFPEPAQSVMHSLLAQWYHNYLQGHLWQLRSTAEYTGPAGPDIRTWGIRHFIDRIQAHYASSVQWQGLKAVPVAEYEIMLTESNQTDTLRPVLYDVLMHRVLDFYSGAESYLTRPAYDFVLTDPAAFAPAHAFSRAVMATGDSVSHTWLALKGYQELITFRLADAGHPEALIDADLKRLRFVYDQIVVDGKDTLYEQALESLRKQYQGNPEVSLVAAQLADLWIQQAMQWQQDKTSPYRDRYRKAIELCRATIEAFPNAYGSQLCKNQIQQIEQKSISASVESIQLPGEEGLASMEYRNVSNVYVKLVRLPESPRRWKEDSWDGDKILSRLNQLPVVHSWQQALKETEDYQPHKTEIATPALPIGHFAILVSDQPDFEVKNSSTGTMLFTVSEIGYWFVDDRFEEQTVAVLNRKTGQPLPGVRTEFFSYEYNSMDRKQEEKKIGEGISDANGWVKVPSNDNRNVMVRLTYKGDELYSDDSFYTYRFSSGGNINPSTLFFSDRAIYRPGQKFYFKGYALEFNGMGMPSIVTNKKVEVVLYDANGQEVDKKSFTTNTFGTFSGHFDLPSGGLTGQMSISSSHGNTRYNFRVEEYKRPKFEVTFDSLKENARLNETVHVVGVARDYAGSAVPGAQVGYRVERVSYRPWWFGYYRKFWPGTEDRQVLETGQAITNEEGKVDVRFFAKSKPGASQDLMYRFETTLFVTDITGESHEATKALVLNQQGYEVNISIPESVALDQLNAVEITVNNSDGNPVKIAGTVEVSLLEGPARNKRNRLWEAPDVITLSEADYQDRLPSYFFPGKENMSEWKVNQVMGAKALEVNGNGTTDLSSFIRQPGYYQIKWKWKDITGKELSFQQYTMAYGTGQALPGQEVMQLKWTDKNYEPGEEVKSELLTGLSAPPKIIRITEHRTTGNATEWMNLPAPVHTSLKPNEDDRGGIHLHYLVAFNNRFYHHTQMIRVPWSNKELIVALKTWRDKLEPGDDETWTISVSGKKGEQVTAEMLLGMYDASLDAFLPHQWSMSLYPSFYSRMLIEGAESREVHYWNLAFHWDVNMQDVPWRQYRDINTYGYFPEGSYYPGRYRSRDGDMDMVVMEAPAQAANMEDSEAVKKSKEVVAGKPQQGESPGGATAQIESPPPLRSALDETVFFYPQINTDEKGQLTFTFRMKEGLTRWKFQALAHTSSLAYGLMEQEVVTQKKLMVFPNPPRFFRAGDTIAFQIKATNVSESDLTAKSYLKILDAFTRQDVSKEWKLALPEQTLQIRKGGSAAASWMLQVPKDWTRPVQYQVYATAGEFTDGEESLLPVVTNRVLVTETLPLPMKADETRTFVFKSMLENKSATSVDHQYVVEMTTSPAWYAVQALPYLMEYPHECAEQVFSRLYANTLANHIATKYPVIQQVYDGWRKTGDDALLSNLEKNQDLKTAMLEETPWVRDAMGETAQKKDIALLFEPNRMRMETQQAIDKLGQMQMSNGGFPWFPGGRDNWYITQYIVEGFGHLEKLGIPLQNNKTRDMVHRAIPYLDSRMIEWYDELKKLESQGKIKMQDHQISALQVHYLYTRSFYPAIQHPAKLDEIMEYLRSQMEKYWLQHGLYDQGLMALASFRTWPDALISKEILASLRERTIVHEELGRYWKMPAGYYWNENQIELQSLMVELFQDMKVPQAEVDELRVWLLKQKQTTRWKTTKATASAVYALLIHPDAWLSSSGIVEVKLGQTSVISAADQVEAGTGYIKKTWTGKEIGRDWSSVTVMNPNHHIAWGSAYWQYWEDLDKVKSSVDNNPLRVTKTLLLSRNTDRGEQTVLAAGHPLKVGDKLIVRLTVETDRPMDFVHLKDMRASGFEPMDVLSGYKWSGGIGYYQSTKDLATHFFIDQLPRGKYVIEYTISVAQAGAYSEGMASLQCMYAPEFSSHSSGSRVSISGM